MSSKSLFLSLNPCRMHFVRTQESHCYNGVMPLTRFKCNCFKPFVIVELSNFHCLVNPSLTSIFAHIRGGESSWHAMAFSWCNRFLSNIFRASLQQCNMKFRRHWNWKWAIERFFFDSRVLCCCRFVRLPLAVVLCSENIGNEIQ